MGVIWQKVWFDLWHYKVRTLLAVLSISAGVFAIGVVFGLADQLLSGMDAAHRSVTPSHLNMILTAYIDRDTALSLKKIPGVLDVEPYNSIGVTYKFREDADWKQATLMMRDQYDGQVMDLTQLKGGDWPVGDDIAVERMSSEFFGAGIGDRVIFKDRNRERTFTIRGVVRHPFVPPPQFGGPAYFFASPDAMERFGVPPGMFAALLVRVEPYSPENARAVATAIKDKLSKQGVNVGGTVYQDPNKHWGRFYIEGMMVVMQMMAVVSLFMSVILVYNTLTALVKQQTNQIGILKAIGGRAGTIVQVYLSGVIVYGLLSLLVSLPLGAFLAYGITATFLGWFNIDYSQFRVSTLAVELPVLAATAVPLLAGLLPVLAGAGITVREAIASYGLGSDFGSSRLDRLIEFCGQRLLPSHYAQAVGNVFRRKGRLILTQLVLVSAGGMFLTVMSLSSSVSLTLDNVFARRQFDIDVYLQGTQRIDRVQNLMATLADVQGVEVWSTVSTALMREGQRAKEAGIGSELDGIIAGSDFFREKVVAGRWLRAGDGRALVMNRETAEKNGIRVGDTVTLDMGEIGKSDWQVIGLYQIVFSGGFSTDALYAPQQSVLEAIKRGPRGNVLLVRTGLAGDAANQAVVQQIKNVLDGQGIRTGYTMTENEYRRIGEGQFGIAISMLLALAVIVAVVGGIGLMGALSISVVERTKEIGVLRAIGARSGTILTMFLLEGNLQGLLSWALSVLVSLVFSQPMSAALGQAMFNMPLDYRYDLQAVGMWLAIVVVISSLASLLPARNATLISVRDSLAYA